MEIQECQRGMRTALMGGFAGQLVSGVIWLAAATIGVAVRPRIAMLALFLGSARIFPLTQLLLRLMGRSARVSPENPLWHLGAQTAFTVPIGFLLVGAATLYRETWFFPAAMVIVGAHYLPFITLYGMRMFGALAAVLVIPGAGLALYGPPIFSLGGWLTGLVLIAFALAGRQRTLREQA